MKVKKSFTLIEVIVVIGAISIVLPALFGIIFSLLRQQIKLYRLSEVKRQGDYALSLMENTIRNYGAAIYDDPVAGPERCNTAGDSNLTVNYFKDNSNYWFRYVLSSGRIASQSEILGASVDLTSTSVTISNLSITCSRTATYSSPVVTIQFQVNSGSGTRQEEKAQLSYVTRIKMKNIR